MDWKVYKDDFRPTLFPAEDTRLASMRGAVVDNPENSLRLTIRLFDHDIIHKAAKRFHACAGYATAKDSGTVNIPRCKIIEKSFALVLMLDAQRLSWFCGDGWMNA